MGFIGKQPSKTAITSSDITDGVVTAAKLASDSVTTAKIADNGVTTAKINADAITDAKIADDVVGSEHLTAGEVDTTALGADAVTAAKIADDAISDEHLDPTAITGQTAETSIADDDLILISDTSASAALKKMTRSNFVSGVGGANTPAFHCGQSTTQTLSNSTFTKLTFDATETLDSDNAFASSRFTPQTAGYYYIYGSLRLHGTTDFDNMNVSIYKNGSSDSDRVLDTQGSHHHYETKKVNGIVYLNGSSDYVELYGRQTSGGNFDTRATDGVTGNQTYFGGYRIIT